MDEQGCVTVGYMIEPDGSTSTHRVLAAFPSKIFDASAIKAAKKFKYSPAEGNVDKIPIFVTNTFTFQIGLGDEKSNMEVRAALSDVCQSAANKLFNRDANDTGSG